MSLAGPQQVSTNPLARLRDEIVAERRATVPFPPGAAVRLRASRG